MPANYYSPYFTGQYFVPQAPTFQPNWWSQPAFNPQVSQQAAQQNVPQAQFSNVWFNGGENEARMYPVAPNNAVALWSETEPIIYLKKADASGKPEFKIFDLVERKNETQENKSVSYASKDDMSSLIGIVKDLGETVGILKSDIESMKGDVYGLAGKKKAVVKKAEVDEDA